MVVVAAAVGAMEGKSNLQSFEKVEILARVCRQHSYVKRDVNPTVAALEAAGVAVATLVVVTGKIRVVHTSEITTTTTTTTKNACSHNNSNLDNLVGATGVSQFFRRVYVHRYT